MYGNSLLLAGTSGSNDVTGSLYDCHGFKLQRHISNEATVITYKAADGKVKRMAVKDAKFRSVKQFGAYGISPAGLSYYQEDDFWVGGVASWNSSSPKPATATNDLIFQHHNKLSVDNIAKENCDIWMTCNNQTDSKGIMGVPAVAWCRSQTIDGNPCDLPNEYELICIWVCGDKLDEMDPTATSYPGLKLSYTRVGSMSCDGNTTSRLFSSTACQGDLRSGNKYAVRHVEFSGHCGWGDNGYNKDQFGGVVPVQELAA